MKVSEFLSQKKYDDPEKCNVAGYVRGTEFLYMESTNKQLPAAIPILQSLSAERSPDIYTNLPSKHWLRTYADRSVHQVGKTTGTSEKHKAVGAMEITPRKLTLAHDLPHIDPPDVAGPLTDGLYRAASDLYGMVPERPGGVGSAHRRALRYYLLACYGLLDICQEFGYAGLNNYVAALMIDDTGKILSWGVNTGFFRHAEVSMLHNYFCRNPDKTTIPDKTIVFSTLTPCEQCTEYLKAAQTPNTLIYFGQEDPGGKGKKGWEISQQMALTASVPKAHLTAEEKERLLQIAGFTEDAMSKEVVISPGKAGVHKVSVGLGLHNCTSSSPKAAATAIGESDPAKMLLKGALRALNTKLARDRTHDADAAVKVPVLTYLVKALEDVS